MTDSNQDVTGEEAEDCCLLKDLPDALLIERIVALLPWKAPFRATCRRFRELASWCTTHIRVISAQHKCHIIIGTVPSRAAGGIDVLCRWNCVAYICIVFGMISVIINDCCSLLVAGEA